MLGAASVAALADASAAVLSFLAIWMIARNARRGPLEAFSFIEREPSLFEYLFVSGTEPHREVAADPFLTWELRVHFAQAAEPPAEAPRTLDQRRIAHNIAVWRGDQEGTAAQRAAIEAEINGQPRSLRLKFLNVWTKTPEG